MSKRFISTDLFSDEWFMDLSKDGKLLYIYLFTNCDHAGIIKLNRKLLKFQTDIKDLDKNIEELGNRCVSVSKELNNVYFLPKFIKFQYPGFPNSRVKQQESAVKILDSYGVDFNSYITLAEDFNESYEHDSDNEYDPVNEDVIEYVLSKLLFDLIKERNPNHKQPDLKSWAKHIDLMIRIDKRTIEEIRGCINWSQQDSFWQNNILSTAKLRKQFDTLYLKAKGSKDGISASITEDKLRRIAESIANDDRLK